MQQKYPDSIRENLIVEIRKRHPRITLAETDRVVDNALLKVERGVVLGHAVEQAIGDHLMEVSARNTHCLETNQPTLRVSLFDAAELKRRRQNR